MSWRDRLTERIAQRYLLDELKLRADPADPEGLRLDNLLPSRVIERRRGICLSLSLLGLALAERAGIDARLVIVPRHAFVRVHAPGDSPYRQRTPASFTARVQGPDGRLLWSRGLQK